MQLAPTPRDELLHDGSATLLRFRRQERGGSPGVPVLLVPSLINRWYVLDLRRQASLVEALVAAGLDVFCVDWGVPRDEDRHLTWDDVLRRLARMARAVKRATSSKAATDRDRRNWPSCPARGPATMSPSSVP